MEAQLSAQTGLGHVTGRGPPRCSRCRRRPFSAGGSQPEQGCLQAPLPWRRSERPHLRLHAAAKESSYREQLLGIQLESQQRLERLREVRLRNEARLKGLNLEAGRKPEGGAQAESPARLLSTPKAVDRRVYDQVAASRNRLSKQLSEKNRYIRHLEERLEERMRVVTTAHAAVVRVGNELEAIKRMSEVAIAAAAYGVDKADAIARSERIVKRAETLKQGILEEAAILDKLVVRRVPIMWYGVASEVKLMGSFDGWTEGYSLSPDDIQDQTFTRFRADVPLLPGSYIVKFQVDTVHWRLAPDWPTVDAEDGSTNNVLVVE